MDCIREETFLVLQCLFNSESGQVRREFSSFSFRRARSHSITSHPPPICAICSQSTPHIPSTHPPLPLTSSLYLFTPPSPSPSSSHPDSETVPDYTSAFPLSPIPPVRPLSLFFSFSPLFPFPYSFSFCLSPPFYGSPIITPSPRPSFPLFIAFASFLAVYCVLLPASRFVSFLSSPSFLPCLFSSFSFILPFCSSADNFFVSVMSSCSDSVRFHPISIDYLTNSSIPSSPHQAREVPSWP